MLTNSNLLDILLYGAGCGRSVEGKTKICTPNKYQSKNFATLNCQ